MADWQVIQTKARQLLDLHGLKDWGFYFDTSNRRYGCCNHSTKEISLSYSLTILNTNEQATDALLHEIAHALTRGEGHNTIWKQKAMQIGCDGNRCYDSKVVIKPKGKYKAVCPSCKREHFNYKKPKRESSCGYCNKYFDRRFLLIYEEVN